MSAPKRMLCFPKSQVLVLAKLWIKPVFAPSPDSHGDNVAKPPS
jgi:hypothetical protein